MVLSLCAAVHEWGSTEAERVEPFPCDEILDESDEVLFRAVSIAAPTDVVFLWLCQLRVAPYSYDWLDNRGRRSPRDADGALIELEVGQRFMGIFRLVAFEAGRSMSADTARRQASALSGGRPRGRLARRGNQPASGFSRRPGRRAPRGC